MTNLGIEDLGLGSANRHQSGRSSKVKRLNDSVSQKSFKSFLSFSSRRTPLPPLRIPKMSKQAFKRWLDARDAYLGHQFPFLRQRPKSRRCARHPHRRRRRRRNQSNADSQTRPSSIKTTEKSINDDDENVEAISIFTLGSEKIHEQKVLSREPSRRKENTSHSESNLRRSGILERIKSFVQSPARSLSCLSLRRRTAVNVSAQSKKKTQIIHDHFDDKCVGTEINDFRSLRSAYSRQDQSIQVDLVRPPIELRYEFDPTMVDGEKQVRRIRSVRTRVEFSDKTTETEFISTSWPNVEKEEKEERKKCNDDKATCLSQVETELDSYIKPANVEPTSSTLQAHQSISMPNSPDEKPTKSPIPSSKSSERSNRIVPLTNLLQTSMKIDQDQRTKSATIGSPTESNLSIQEQLQR